MDGICSAEATGIVCAIDSIDAIESMDATCGSDMERGGGATLVLLGKNVNLPNS